MKLLKRSGLALGLALATLFSCSKENTDDSKQFVDSEVAQASSQVIPGQYIVVYNNSGDSKSPDQKRAIKDKTETILMRNNITNAEVLQVYSSALSGVALKLSADEAKRLKNDEDVVHMEPDRIVSLGKPSWAGGGGSTTSGQETPYGITRVNGVTGSFSGGTAWIIDTGIDLDHPDLNVDVSRSRTMFTSGKDAQSPDDGNGHGSHVAGTIAAIDNDFGVVGVAPGATVVAVKVLDSRGSGSYSGVIAGVDYVAANGKAGDVANMSLGGPVSDLLDQAVLEASKNVKFALAAGNESDDSEYHSPARTDGTNIYTISAMDKNDNWASFSNYGSHVDYCAPGVNIKSTWKDGGYNTISGTSMASPHAAGVLLLGNFGTDGTVNGDPDGTPDPIIVH